VKTLLGWLRSRRPPRQRTDAASQLTDAELTRLARWANAYRAEAVYGAEDGKRWAFARYLVETGRLNEDRSLEPAASASVTPLRQRTRTLNCAVGGGSLPSRALGWSLTNT
jgi:hypothetical protein